MRRGEGTCLTCTADSPDPLVFLLSEPVCTLEIHLALLSVVVLVVALLVVVVVALLVAIVLVVVVLVTLLVVVNLVLVASNSMDAQDTVGKSSHFE